MNKILKTILLILITLAGVSMSAFAAYIPFNTNVNMNIGIGTSTPQGAFVVTNGNVGIGTWAPAVPFQVNGSNQNIYFTSTGNIGIGSYNAISESPLTIWANPVPADHNELALIRDISATGSNSTFGAIHFSSAPGVDFEIGKKTVNSTGYFQIRATATPDLELVTVDENGNVGIGTNVPGNTQGLSVLGGTSLGAYATSAAPAGGLITSGNVGIGSLAPGQKLDVTGTLRTIGFTMSGQTPVSGYVLTASDSSGDATWTSPGATSGWTVSGNNVYETSGGNVGIGTINPFGGNLIINGGGNVGIGSLVPGQLLDVQGTVRDIGEVVNGAISSTLDSNVTTPPSSYTGVTVNYVGDTGGGSGPTLTTLIGEKIYNNLQKTTLTTGISLDLVAPYTVKGGTTYYGMEFAHQGNETGFEVDSASYTNAYGIYLGGPQLDNTATLTNYYGIYIGTPCAGVACGAPSSVLSNNYGVYIDDQSTAGGGAVNTYSIYSAGGNSYFKGNVGIGSVTPGQELDVTGTARMTGLTLTGNGAANGNVLVGNSIGVGTWMPASTLGVSGGAGTNYWLLNGGSNVGINTTQAVGIGTSFVGGVGEAKLSVMNGNVGIGTWVPGALLQLGNATTGSGGGAAFGINIGASGANLYSAFGNNSDLETDASVLYFSQNPATIYGAGGAMNVEGVGGATQSTSVNLLSHSSFTATSGDQNGVDVFETFAPTSGTSTYESLEVTPTINQTGGASGISRGIWIGSALTSAHDYRAIETDYGNVGIGTISGNLGIGSQWPGQRLDVNGTARMSGFTLTGNGAASGNVLVGNGVGVGTWMPASTLATSAGTNYWLLNGGGNVGINTTQAVGIGTSFVGGAGEAKLSVMNGNVGIGTWVPAGKFQVGGSSASPFIIDANGNVGIGTTQTSSNALTIMNGNVGIGTWATPYIGNPANFVIEGVPGGSADLFVAEEVGGPFVHIDSEATLGAVDSRFSEISPFGNDGAITFDTGLSGPAVNTSGNEDFIILSPTYDQTSGTTSDTDLLINRIETALGSGNQYFLDLQATGIDKFVINNKGNVGIGTSNPFGGNLIVNGGGNVGIGSLIPGQALDVKGTVRMTGLTLIGNGAANGNVLVGNSIGVGTWMPASTLGVSGGAGTNYWLNDTAGNVGINTAYAVGIGTISQINKLNILGNVGIGTFSYDPYMKTQAPSGGMIMAGNLGIGTWVPAAAIEVGPYGQTAGPPTQIYFANTSNTAGYPQFLGQWTGTGSWGIGPASVAVDNNLEIGPSSNTPGQTWGVGGTVLNLVIPYGNIGIGTLATANSALTVMNGNVGIGTWIPALMLDIKGTARMTGFALSGNGAASGNVMVTNGVGVGTWMPASTLLAGGGTNYWLLNGGAGNVGINTSYAVGIGTTFVGGTGEAALSVMNGNVGIGTWVPSDTLEVSGAAGGSIGILSPEFSASVLTFGYPGQFRGRVQYSNDAADDLALISSGIITFSVNDAGSTAMTLDPNGNLGIGTATPVGGLAVMNGNVGIGTWVPDAELNITSPSIIGNPLLDINVAGQQHVLHLDNAGRLAYGINVNYDGISAINFGNNLAENDTATFFVINPASGNTGNLFQILKGATNEFLVNTNGNVGIGSLTPGQALDVTGTVRAIGLTMSGQTPISGYVLTASDSSGDTTWTSPGVSGGWTTSGNNVYETSGGNVGIGTTFVNQAALSVMNGNVGIGTWLPRAVLDVEGTLSIVYFGGNVGIGTGAPATTLDISAPGGAEENFEDTNLTIPNYSTFDSPPVTTHTYASIQANGATQGGMQLMGFTSSTLNAYPPVTIYGTFGNTNTDGAQAILFVGDKTDGGTATQNLANSDIMAQFYNGSAALMTILGSGNVGIGSVTPGQLLDVQGTARMTGFTLSGNGAASGNVMVTNGVGVGTWMSTTTLPIATVAVETTGDVTYYSASNSFAGGTGFQTNGTNVGIGTSNLANASLQVVGNIGIGTVKNGDNFITTAPPNGGFIVEGNVGVGSWAPGQKLDVQGTLRALGELVNGNVGIGTTFINGAGEGALTVMNGNVGIGTWVPSSPLAVEGAMTSIVPNATGTMTAFEYNGVNEPGTYMEVGNTTSDTETNFYMVDPYSSNGHQVASEIAVATDINLGDANENDEFLWVNPGLKIAYLGSEQENGNNAGGAGFPLVLTTQNNDAAGVYIGSNAGQNVGIGTTTPAGGFVVMNGNVGIGTWVPAAQLDVEGTLSVAIFHGNVGIGTATVPAFNLDLVNGTARERNVRRVNTVASSATPTINTNTTDLFTITALAANITSFTTNLSGTPNNGDLLEIRILDNGTARTIAWGASFASTTTTLPLTTVAGIWLRILFEYNSTTSLWECVAST